MSDNLANVKGRIFDIQRFSIHDGPGIRTIVFFKGCALRCKWCCNPESQHYEIETMTDDNGKVTVWGRDVTAAEVMETVMKDRNYYRRSGGGITLSGGEFLFQPDFAEALLKTSIDEGITTAVETTSFAQFSVIERVLPYIDNYLMDIKHIDPVKHKFFTSQSNELILENAQKIAPKARRMVVRVPVVPGFNDTKEEIRAIAEFAATLQGVEELHLLPYHRLGQDKYRWLGREYSLSNIVPPTAEHILELLNEAEKSGLKCQVGG